MKQDTISINIGDPEKTEAMAQSQDDSSADGTGDELPPTITVYAQAPVIDYGPRKEDDQAVNVEQVPISPPPKNIKVSENKQLYK